jgi:hypothetical protein
MNTDTARDPKLNYGAETWRAPAAVADETILFDEPGRVLPTRNPHCDTDYRAYYLRLVKDQYGQTCLRIRHGAGEERYTLGTRANALATALAKLDSDERYSVLFAAYDLARDAATFASNDTAHEYRTAFVDGRLKKRKRRGQQEVKVWIEPKKASLTKST